MSVTETTTTSYGSRVKKSFGGIGTGFIMFIAGTCLLWWNEGRAVKTAKMLEEAQGVAVHVDNVASVDPSLTGQLIHATSQASVSDSLRDDVFGFAALAIKVDRDVEYYQYVEKSSSKSEDKLGGSQETTTTYTCSPSWAMSPVNSSEFHGENADKYINSVLMKFDDERFVAENVKFGGYTLNTSLVSGINGSVPSELNVDAERIRSWNEAIARTLDVNPDSCESVHVNGNVIYFGKNPDSPQIGDVRVTFTQVNPGLVSLLAQVNGNSFESYKAKNGKTLSVISMGNVSMDRMFEQQEEANTMWLWICRVVGVLIVIGGLKGIFGILSMLLKVVPFLASIMNWGVSLICNIVGFVWSLLIIAIAWIVYRPVLAISILVVAIALIGYFVYRGKQKKTSEVAEPVAPQA